MTPDPTPLPPSTAPDLPGAPGGAGPGVPGPHAAPPGGPAAPPPLARRLVAPLAVLGGVGAAFAYVGAVDPNEPGHYPVCPLLSVTGLYCPGCGGLRSAHAFVHGDLAAAFGANAAAVAGYLVFAVLWAVWVVRAVRGRPMRVGVPPLWGWVLGGVLVVFSVVRNLPFGSALAP